MGEGEYNIGMNFLFANQVRIAPPQLEITIGGGREGVVKVMHKRTTSKTFSHAKELHRNMSPAEAKLWKHLRAHQMGDVHFRNQHAIGNCIVDFCAPRKKLIIELDGSQHLEQEEYDNERSKYLEARGYRVLRFWNNDVMNNIESVLKMIWSVLQEKGGEIS
jgi:very-short-patch-repair endonuclease